MARAIQIDWNQAGSAHRYILGAPLLAALVFSFGFVFLSPQPSRLSQPVTASKPTLLISSPQPKLATVDETPQQKLSTLDTPADESISSIVNHARTASPQSGAGSANSLQSSQKSQSSENITQSLLSHTKLLLNSKQ